MKIIIEQSYLQDVSGWMECIAQVKEEIWAICEPTLNEVIGTVVLVCMEPVT